MIAQTYGVGFVKVRIPTSGGFVTSVLKHVQMYGTLILALREYVLVTVVLM